MVEPCAVQQYLPLRLPNEPFVRHQGSSVLDLFTGVGGLALGFRQDGYEVIGVDNDPMAAQVYELAGIGSYVSADLLTDLVIKDVMVVTGGPPCRPWSIVNTKRRRSAHADHALLGRFFQHIREIRPAAFLMENVPVLQGDSTYRACIQEVRASGYSVASQVIKYSDFGSATSRRRLFTVGIRASVVGATDFFTRLEARHAPATTVGAAISWLRDMGRDQYPDHDWSLLETIHKYEHRYQDGRYGWKRLAYDRPAPSFGSIAKTYILHPEAGTNGFPLRVLSVREAMCISGLPTELRFPNGASRSKRYQMVANVVTPAVARACAGVLRNMLGSTTPDHSDGFVAADSAPSLEL